MTYQATENDMRDEMMMRAQMRALNRMYRKRAADAVKAKARKMKNAKAA